MNIHSSQVLFSACLLLSTSCQAANLALPVTEFSEIALVDTQNGDGPLFRYAVGFSNDSSGDQETYYSVGITLRATDIGHPLRPAASRIVFQPGELISSASNDYYSDGGTTALPLHSFDEFRPAPGRDWEYFDKTSGQSALFARALTQFFIGFRFAGDDGQHYGWMRFNRPNTNFLTFFELSAYDWNPLPGEPIQAGLPPPIQLMPQVDSGGELHLTWPAAVTGWVLESSELLGPGGEWQPVPDVGGNEFVLPPPETNRFYRLRRP